MSHVHHHSATAEGGAAGVGVVILLFGAVMVAPGALIVFGVDRLMGLALDCGQLWTFAAVASAVLIGALAAAARSFASGLWWFVLIGLGVAALLLVSRFGFHASWPGELWRAFTRGG